ncbi:MAG TPA: serine/threonine-protein kinase [Bryobacteraceae bacterium]|nr:serine/threonine-protein kinase [Bryobacteraceae bacterium]
MMRCPSCQAELRDPARFCPHCAAGLDGAAATQTFAAPGHKPASSSSASSDEGRFPAGTTLGERYRVLGLLGRGGMGEVYRATDLKLNQGVALKFLPAATSRNPRLLERFHGEVRIARQVSHPNVCRVYDLGEIDGAPYISMEYVDGEDLGSLLRRIGRLPGDKAVEIARKLCAGLAAAHAKGVLHRDLKPANVMIDGRGQVLIMDFGLAAIVDQVEGAEVRNGTPAYMAPEQLAGREVTERSDIYSLGLVLYEMFTGKRAFETRDRSAVPSAASVIKDVDPAVERLIAKCLDPDAAKRPQSALAVARGLPGGDPLAEALAAGDTPSPEMVAASEDTGALSVRAAVVCLACVVVGLIALLLLSSRTRILRLTPFPNSQEILARQGREIAARLGYTDLPVDTFDQFSYENEYYDWAKRSLKREDYREQIRLGQPALIYFTHRESPAYLETRDPFGRPTPNDPPTNVAGMVSVDLDPQGRMIGFLGVPPLLDDGAAAQPFDWKKLFDAAGLDPSRWTATASRETPPYSFDERKAWTGTFAHAPNMPMRIEAAAWKGRPVFFALFGPWQRTARTQPQARTTGQRAAGWSLIAVISIVLVGAVWLAMRNLRGGRGDNRGALRLAAYGLIFQALGEIVRLHHVPTLAELLYIVDQISIGLFVAALVWALYMALEPYLRRRWPQSLISWTRLLAGDARDPLVAGHILVGTALGVGFTVLLDIRGVVAWQRLGDLTLGGYTIRVLDVAGLTGWLLWNMIGPVYLALVIFFFFFLLRLALRKTWAIVAVCVALVGLGNLAGPDPLVATGFVMALVFAGLWVMIRFGILPFTLVLLLQIVGSQAPFTSDLSAWYVSKGLVVVALVLALAVWSFRNALGGRKVLQGDFLEH